MNTIEYCANSELQQKFDQLVQQHNTSQFKLVFQSASQTRTSLFGNLHFQPLNFLTRSCIHRSCVVSDTAAANVDSICKNGFHIGGKGVVAVHGNPGDGTVTQYSARVHPARSSRYHSYSLIFICYILLALSSMSIRCLFNRELDG